AEEGTARPRTVRMESAGHQLLAGPGLPADQNRDGERGHAFDRLPHRLDPGARADQPEAVRRTGQGRWAAVEEESHAPGQLEDDSVVELSGREVPVLRKLAAGDDGMGRAVRPAEPDAAFGERPERERLAAQERIAERLACLAARGREPRL